MKKNIWSFDFENQILEYVMFLMLPRADYLYEGIEGLDYVFPFLDVKKGSRVVIYSMGTYGQHLYRFIKQSGCAEIIVAVDRNFEELSKQGFCVESPDNIQNYEYDAILLPMSYARTRRLVYHELIQKYGDCVYTIDEAIIKNEEIVKGFGIIGI